MQRINKGSFSSKGKANAWFNAEKGEENSEVKGFVAVVNLRVISSLQQTRVEGHHVPFTLFSSLPPGRSHSQPAWWVSKVNTAFPIIFSVAVPLRPGYYQERIWRATRKLCSFSPCCWLERRHSCWSRSNHLRTSGELGNEGYCGQSPRGKEPGPLWANLQT